MLSTALSPLAMSMNARPPVRLSMDARNEAMTCGSRVIGFVGRRPTRARVEPRAISVARTYASPPMNAVSCVATASAP